MAWSRNFMDYACLALAAERDMGQAAPARQRAGAARHLRPSRTTFPAAACCLVEPVGDDLDVVSGARRIRYSRGRRRSKPSLAKHAGRRPIVDEVRGGEPRQLARIGKSVAHHDARWLSVA